MPIDVERARRDTPATEQIVHLNSAGASLMPTPVLDAVTGHLRLEARIGGYEAADAAEAQWEHTYDSLAALLNCTREEIAVVENATRAWDMLFYSLPFAAGDRILTARAEYVSNYLAYLQVARRTGARVELIPDDASGQLDVEALRGMVDERVKLIAITHVPTNGGLVNPAAEVGAVAREAGVLYLLDACQSAGQLPLDVQAIGCDMLTATGRKFVRAPRGTGFLYARRDLLRQLEPPFVDVGAAHWDAQDSYTLRDDARRFENWETNYATKIGLGVASDYAQSWGIEEICARNYALAGSLREQLGALPGVRVLDLGVAPCSIVTFAVNGCDAESVQRALARRGVYVSVSLVEDARLDMERRGYEGWVRASVHYFNVEQELSALVAAVADLDGRRGL